MCRVWPTPTPMSACTASSAACCARRWKSPISRPPSACTRPPSSCARWAKSSASTPNPSSSGKSAPPSNPSGTCGAPSPRTSSARPASPSSRTRPTRAASAISWKRKWAFPAPSRYPAKPGPRPTTPRFAHLVQTKTPLILFGSYNERMYLAEAGETRPEGDLHPGVLPRCHHPPPHRHAFHGLRGRDLHHPGSLQRAVRRALQHPAARHRPRPRRSDAVAPPRRTAVGRRRAGRRSTSWWKPNPS